ncbi:hypothetical protein V8F20_004225 [Naviculisporaceae sp. PSN 640]
MCVHQFLVCLLVLGARGLVLPRPQAGCPLLGNTAPALNLGVQSWWPRLKTSCLLTVPSFPLGQARAIFVEARRVECTRVPAFLDPRSVIKRAPGVSIGLPSDSALTC